MQVLHQTNSEENEQTKEVKQHEGQFSANHISILDNKILQIKKKTYTTNLYS